MAGQKRGRVAALYIDTGTATPTWTKLGGRLDATFTIATDTIEATNADSGRWKEYIEGDTSGTISGSFHYLPDDAGQIALMAAKIAGESVSVQWVPVDEASGKTYTAEAIITSLAQAAPQGDLQNTSFDLQLSGAITEGTKTA